MHFADIEDLADVEKESYDLASKWWLLCSFLGVKESSLQLVQCNYPRDAGMCLHMGMVEWLNWNYNHRRYGKPSWRKLAAAVFRQCTV